jgi:hypothetical protein
MTARDRRMALVRLDMAVCWTQRAAAALSGPALLEAQAAIRCLEAARQAVRAEAPAEVVSA